MQYFGYGKLLPRQRGPTFLLDQKSKQKNQPLLKNA